MVNDLLWGGTEGMMAFLSVFSFFIFLNTRDKVYVYYSVYCLLVFSYIFIKSGIVSVKASVFWTAFNWYVQILYLNVYWLFGLYFCKMEKHAGWAIPKVFKYQYAMVGLSTVFFILTITGILSTQFFHYFFLLFFLPAHLIISIYLLWLIFRSKSKMRNFILLGSISYIFFAMLALLMSMDIIDRNNFRLVPINYFYIGVILECSCLSLGLSNQIKGVYLDKIITQRKLAKAQSEIRKQLEKEIEFVRQKNQLINEQKEKQEIIARVAVLENTVLRSQMNSHFIFNVLNSLKLFIIENKNESALSYLNDFAKFIRKVLDGSMYENSTIDDEIEALSLYLNIEKIRFGDKFDYKIDFDKNIGLASYPFPALLLQPFVENALKHGLMPSANERQLKISFKKERSKIIICIDDNGVGLNNSRKNNAKYPLTDSHHSHGLNIISSRISDFNERGANKISYSIINKEENFLGKGTQVILEYVFQTSSGDIMTSG